MFPGFSYLTFSQLRRRRIPSHIRPVTTNRHSPLPACAAESRLPRPPDHLAFETAASESRQLPTLRNARAQGGATGRESGHSADGEFDNFGPKSRAREFPVRPRRPSDAGSPLPRHRFPGLGNQKSPEPSRGGRARAKASNKPSRHAGDGPTGIVFAIRFRTEIASMLVDPQTSRQPRSASRRIDPEQSWMKR